MNLPVIIQLHGKTYKTDLKNGLDISIPLEDGPGHVSAWSVDPIKMEPVRNGNWIGEVRQGGSVNFRNIFFNPHGHGTHTESVGHISPEIHSINRYLKEFFSKAQLLSVHPEIAGDDQIVRTDNIRTQILDNVEALIIRTLPNSPSKKNRNWSDQNPPYLEKGFGTMLREKGIRHLLLDLPSVDREKDEGILQVHHEFWNYPENPRLDATITEMIFVADNIPDGLYLLNLQVAPFENDASPSRPVLFPLELVS
jgi:arylformamidase